MLPGLASRPCFGAAPRQSLRRAARATRPLSASRDRHLSVAAPADYAAAAAATSAAASSSSFDIDQLARQPMTSLSLNDLYRVASSPTDEQNLLNAQFVRRELPIRYAHRCAQLRNLPFGLAADERIEHAARTYEQQAEALFLHPKPDDASSKRSFDSLLRSSQPKLLEVPETFHVACGTCP